VLLKEDDCSKENAMELLKGVIRWIVYWRIKLRFMKRSSGGKYLYMEEVEDAEALNGEDCYDGDKDGNDDDTDDEEQTSCLTEKYFESEEKLAMVA